MRLLASRSTIAWLWLGLAAAAASAATFQVDSTTDSLDARPGDGICADAAGHCTLRAAILETNALVGADVVEVPPGSFVLSIPGPSENGAATGDLDLTGPLTLRGDGADSTTIDGGALDRVLDVFGSVSIEGVTITGGRDSGGVWVEWQAELALDSVAVRDNDGMAEGLGGGITVAFGSLAMRQSSVHGNRGGAGGIAVIGNASIVGSTISSNQGRCWGCPLVPGCVASGAGAVATVGRTVIRHTTIAENDCPEGRFGGEGWALNPGGGGGGLFSAGEIQVGDSVLAESPCEQYTSSGHNVDTGFLACALAPDPTDLHEVDPLIGPLIDNGGPTPTHALLPGSPAIDAVPPGDCVYDDDDDPATPVVPLATDQRGVPRPRGAGCDIGAYEMTQCANGRDDDYDGRRDFDGGAWLDEDGDGFVDAAFDPATPPVTAPDPQCSGDASTKGPEAQACGLGFELVLLLAMLEALRSARRRVIAQGVARAGVVALLVGAGDPAAAISVELGTQFTGRTMPPNIFAPDTMGAVGPDHVVELTNAGYAVHRKSDGAVVQEVEGLLAEFWIEAGVTPVGYAFDPRVVYDASSERWFAVAIDGLSAPGVPMTETSHYLVAVSKGADPTEGWTGFSITSDPTGASWADFPMPRARGVLPRFVPA